MKYKVEWTLSGSTFIEADNALDAALAVKRREILNPWLSRLSPDGKAR